MSGGIAYVYDPEDKFVNGLCNTETIEFEEISKENEIDLKSLIERHVLYTDSKKGESLLADWSTSLNNFVKVMPTEYKKALKRLATEEPMFEELTTA
jgi:glutamate synthase (ferredoxin)